MSEQKIQPAASIFVRCGEFEAEQIGEILRNGLRGLEQSTGRRFDPFVLFPDGRRELANLPEVAQWVSEWPDSGLTVEFWDHGMMAG